jgi:MFS family permease
MKDIFTGNFVFCFLAFFIFAAANHALTPTIPVYLVKLGSHEREIGVLVGIFGVSSLVSRFFVGGWLRKHSEKSAMMMGALLFAIGSLAFIVLRPFWPFFAVRLVQGISFACLDTAAFAYVVNVVPMIYRGQGLAYFMLAPNLALSVAPAFAMFLVNRYSFTLFFVVCMVLALGAFVFSYPLKGNETAGSEQATNVSRTSFFEKRIVAPAVMGFLHTFAYGAIVAFLPLYAIQKGVANPGLFFTAVAVMIIAGRSLGARVLDAWSKERIILVFLSAAILSMFILSFSETLPMFIVVGLIWGTGTSFLAPATMAYAFEYAGSSDGTFRALTDSGVGLGPMIMGTIIPVTGYRGMFLCLAFILFVNLAYFQYYVRKRKRT